MKDLTKCYCGHTTTCDCGPKEELGILEVPMPIHKGTLEEANEIITTTKFSWQQERSYSEEDMKQAFHVGRLYLGREGDTNFEQFIEEFKKK